MFVHTHIHTPMHVLLLFCSSSETSNLEIYKSYLQIYIFALAIFYHCFNKILKKHDLMRELFGLAPGSRSLPRKAACRLESALDGPTAPILRKQRGERDCSDRLLLSLWNGAAHN